MTALSHVRGSTDRPLIESTIGEVFNKITELHPTVTALVSRHQDTRLSYAELRTQVDRLAIGLMRLGMRQGDRLGIWAPNCAEWVLTQFATAKLGVILVNVNPAYQRAELEYAVNKVEMRVLITARQFKSSNYLSMLSELRRAQRLPSLEHVIVIGAEGTSGTLGFDRVLIDPTEAELQELDRRSAKLRCTDAVNIQFTSGTTGAPKGATLTHRNILNNGNFVVDALGLGVAESICLPVPLYHCFGMVMGTLGLMCHGGTIVLPSEGFEPLATLDAIEAERCAAVYAVPTMFIAMLQDMKVRRFDLSDLRTGIMAGSPCPMEVMRQVIDEMGCTGISIAYGMTETSPVSFQSAIDDPIERRVTTVGRIQPHAEVKIIDPETKEVVPRGIGGELCTRGYLVMDGYWGDLEKTEASIDADGFMHTGDLAVMDHDGYVNIVGRSKDMVIRGGENIYPREVEEFLYGHPGISDVQVVGVPDLKYGEVLCAVVIASDDSLGADDVRAFCQGRIAHYKIPKFVAFVDAFPMTVTGKVQKFILREEMTLQFAAGAA